MNEHVFELLRVNNEINGRITFQHSNKRFGMVCPAICFESCPKKSK